MDHRVHWSNMQTNTVINYLKRLVLEAQNLEDGSSKIHGVLARAREFIRAHIGDDSEFYNALLFMDEKKPDVDAFIYIVKGFIEYIEEGFESELTPLQQAEQNIVSDFLDQARTLLSDKKVHPAAAIVLIGATLEEFLRNWIERESLKLGNRKPSISAYADLLSRKGKISKQDIKDILAWSGLRNEAAHGNWETISSRERAKIMLEGVNLFLRKNISSDDDTV